LKKTENENKEQPNSKKTKNNNCYNRERGKEREKISMQVGGYNRSGKAN